MECHGNSISLPNYLASRARFLEPIMSSLYPYITDPVKPHLIEVCKSTNIHLLSAVALLSPRVPLGIKVGDVDRVIHLLKTLQCVEYEDLSEMERQELDQRISCSFIGAELFDCNQSTSTEFIRLWTQLVDACSHLLILDLIKLIQEYTSVTELLHVGMPIDVFDSVCSWEIATIERIVCMRRDNFIRIHYIGWGCKYDEWISVHSARIRLLRNKQGQIMRKKFAALGLGYPLNELGSYDFHNHKTGAWEKCTYTVDRLSTVTGMKITDWNQSRDLVPAGTYT